MKLYPAIDIKGGSCVRLRQGAFDDVTVYNSDPSVIAQKMCSEGAEFLHIVDLDGALEGRRANLPTIRKIIDTVNIPIEVGGGIRTTDDAKELISMGVSRVIIGTKAISDPELIDTLIDALGTECVVVGVDAKDGFVATHGWVDVSDISATNLCLSMKHKGVKHIIYTDISKDGMMSGPNVVSTKKLKDDTGMDIIASGGISCIEDIADLYEAGISGTIIGKAYYEGKLNLQEAITKFR